MKVLALGNISILLFFLIFLSFCTYSNFNQGMGAAVVGWHKNGFDSHSDHKSFLVRQWSKNDLNGDICRSTFTSQILPKFPFLLFSFLNMLILTMGHILSRSKHRIKIPIGQKMFLVKILKNKVGKNSKISLLTPKVVLAVLLAGIHITSFSAKPASTVGCHDPIDRELFDVESLSYIQVQNSINRNESHKQLALSKMNPSNHRSFFILLILTSGDVSLNPGPTKYPCTICEKGVRKGIFCTNCKMWVHQKCEGMSNAEYNRLFKMKKEFTYQCGSCNLSKEMPFYDEKIETPIEQPIEQPILENANQTINDDVWLPFKKRGLHILHLNVNSLLSKIEEMRQIALASNAAVIGITESKLDETVLDGEVNIEGYKIIRADRNRNGGGVACYIKSDLSYNIRKDFSTEIENIFFDILLPNSKPILVGIVYRPPDESGFLSKLTEAIGSTESFDEQEVIILGDININLLNGKFAGRLSLPKNYREFCSMHGLKQIIATPTRVTEKTATLLDHVLTNSKDRISQSGVLEIGISDHMPIFCTRKITHTKLFDHKYISIRSLKNYSQEKFIEALKNVAFPDYSKYESVDDAYDDLINKLIEVIEGIAPIKRVRVKGNTKEWFDEEIHNAIKIRDKNFSAFKKSKLNKDKISYKKSKNIVQSLIKKKKKHYVKTKLDENIAKPKELWKTLKSLGLSETKKGNIKIALKHQDQIISDPQETSEIFKIFFSNLASDLVNKLPPAQIFLA